MIIPARGLYVWNLVGLVPEDPDDQYATFSKPNDGVYIYPLYFQNLYPNNIREKAVNIYHFNKDTGRLKIAMPKDNLDALISEIGELPSNGETIYLVNPPTIYSSQPHIVFNNVKTISQLDPFDGKYALKYIIDVKNKTTNFVINTYRKQDNKN